MFSALKFVTAAAIVALFGGFLLAGILTTPQDGDVPPAAVTESPSPTTTERLLSGMLTEEVEPGMFRVVNDGVRDLVLGGDTDIVAGYDGGIWLLRGDGFLRLGSEGSYVWPDESSADQGRIFEVAPDGTIWIIAPGNPYIPGSRGGDILRSANGEVWAAEPCPEACAGVTVAPDGKVWASWQDQGRRVVGHLGPTGWEPLDGRAPSGANSGVDRLYPTDAGDLYATATPYGRVLYRYQGGTWPAVSYLYQDTVVDVGRDGTIWQSGGASLFGEVSDSSAFSEQWPVPEWDTVGSELSWGLARFTEDEWTAWTVAELPDACLLARPGNEFRVASDGSLWASRCQRAVGDPQSGDDYLGPTDYDSAQEERIAAIEAGRLVCDGLVRFDGMTADHFLPGRCVSIDIAADGSAWVLADNPDGKDLYVITPTAVTAGE